MTHLQYSVADLASALMWPVGALALGLVMGLLYRISDATRRAFSLGVSAKSGSQ